jgi:hypothetical protein
VASTSWSTQSMLPEERGAGAATTSDGTFKAPPCTGPRRVKALEAPGVARFASSCLGAPMCRGLRRRASTGCGSSPCSCCPGGARSASPPSSIQQRWRRRRDPLLGER